MDTITSSRGDGAITLSWNITSDGGSPLLRYEIQCSSDSGYTYSSCFSNITPSGEAGDTFTTTLSGVSNSQMYYLRLRAVNAVGASPWNGVEVMPAQLPSTVTNVSVSRVGFSVTATWDEAEATDSYLVELSAWTPGPNVVQTQTGVTATTASFTIANFDDSHTVSVTSKSVFGSGERADSSLVRPPSPPSAPASVTGTRSYDGASLDASWSAVEGVTGYDRRYKADGGTVWNTWGTTTADTSGTLTGIGKSKAYIVSVRSVKTYEGNGVSKTLTSDWKDSGKIHTPPGKVRDISHTANTVGMILESYTVRWTIPQFTGTGSATLKFNVSCRESESAAWVAVKTNATIPIVAYDPVKYAGNFIGNACVASSSQMAIAAINEVVGEAEVHSLRLQ